jgi:hypothetical protein
MNRHTHRQLFHRSWFAPHKTRTVDKTGIAIALAFLVAIGVLAGGRGEKPVDQHDPLSQTNLSASIVSDPGLTASFRQDRPAAQDVAPMPLLPGEPARR